MKKINSSYAAVGPHRFNDHSRWAKRMFDASSAFQMGMRRTALSLISMSAVALAPAAVAQSAAEATSSVGTVKVTPLGGMDGEFCVQDRALVFEDPNGTRILYDPGSTVAGANDPRLGRIDMVLVSHLHGDHVGGAHIKTPNAGTCENPDVTVSAAPQSSAVLIAIAKKAKIVSGSEMPSFFATRLKAAGGNPDDAVLARFGGEVILGGVKIATVQALHSNGVDPDFIGGELGKQMNAAGIVGNVGSATGFVLRFSNGLVVYLSGDTGITSDQDLVVRRYYHAKLAVINIGDVYTTGPAEAAYVINDLVQPTSVIPSHANEAATNHGKVRAGSLTEQFIKAVNVPAYPPLSGKTMAFDAAGRCTQGC